MSVAGPLRPGPSGRYLVDANGIPFRIHGEASWDAHINLSRTDWQSYLQDRANKGCTALFTYVFNSVAYYNGSSAPKAVQSNSLPFSLNASGGSWNGDPTFANHDAAYSSPVDSYFANFALFCSDASALGMVVIANPCYAGFSQGTNDGWLQTTNNSANTTSVCNAFGAYLATGHGVFGGLASVGNLIICVGGDTLLSGSSTGALRTLQILEGMQANGCNQPVTMHWQRNYLPNDSTNFSSSLTAYGHYVDNPAYPMARAIYGTQSPVRPIFTVEDCYWGDPDNTGAGMSRAQLRYCHWSEAITCQCGGSMIGFTPFWGFTASGDGTTGGGNGTSPQLSTSWAASTAYTLNAYASKGGKWYRCTAPGTSGTTGPSGTGSSISDGGVTWTFAATVSASMGGMANLLNEPGILDNVQVANMFSSLPWWRLVPESLGAMGTIITSGQGTQQSFTDQSEPTIGSNNWIVSAAADDTSTLVAYVPSSHSGSFSIDMTKLGSNPSLYWLDPTNGARTYIGSFTNTGTKSLSVPGTNSGGDNDWVLIGLASGTKSRGWVG